MKMNEGLDTGDLLLEEKIKIDNDDNLNTLSEKLSILSAKLFLNATLLLEENINKNTNPQLTKQNTLGREITYARICLLYTSDAADEGLGVDLGGRRIIKKTKYPWKRNYLRKNDRKIRL